MSSAIDNGNTTNREETYKLYSLLLPYSIYDNPYKQYSRKVKVKKNISLTNHSEYMVISPYWTVNNITSANYSMETSGVKTRKKMKLTTAIVDNNIDADTPKHNNIQHAFEEDTATNLIIVKPDEYEKINTIKYNLSELRALCSHYGIKKSGTKTDLSLRIYTFLKQTYFIRKIQRNFKDYLSKKYRKLSGPGYLHHTKCVNDTDFYTFDKISQIKPMELFTYQDTDNKIYGFHIASIFHLIVSSHPKITNPYNRNIISSSVIKNMYEKLIYGSLIGFRVSVKLDDEEVETSSDTTASIIGSGGVNRIGGGTSILSREKQEELFIVDLFQHINTLGNYSDSEWFIVLQRDELIRFIRNIHDIWYYRANLTQEMKERICPPHGNPFVLHNAHVNLNVITLLTFAEIRTICVSIIERMTQRGVSREDQCLGAFYVLATLTIVNQDARNALPWLYEAVL